MPPDAGIGRTNTMYGSGVCMNDGTGLFVSSGRSLNEPNVAGVYHADADPDGRPEVFVGKIEGFGGTRLYFNRTDAATRSSSWGAVKSLSGRRQERHGSSI